MDGRVSDTVKRAEEMLAGTPDVALSISQGCNGTIWILGEHPEVGEVSFAEVRSGCDEAAELFEEKATAKFFTAAPSLVRQLCEEVKRLQMVANDSLDKLPARWNMGFQAGLKQAIPYEKELTDALATERQARQDDNAALTADTLAQEAELTTLRDVVEKVRERCKERYQSHNGDYDEYFKGRNDESEAVLSLLPEVKK